MTMFKLRHWWEKVTDDTRDRVVTTNGVMVDACGVK